MELFLLKDGNPNAVEPAHGVYLNLDSHGSRIFGRLLLPDFFDKESRCPVVLMLHGQPGGDKNFDIAEALRANGYGVAVISYRGIWGSHGYYRLSHNIEDVIATVDFLREMAADYRLDPDRVYLFGHSMGGFSALNAMARGLQVSGAVLMAPYDTGYTYLYDRENFTAVTNCKNRGYFNLDSENAFEEDAQANAESWYFRNLIPHLDQQASYCFIDGAKDTTSRSTDGLAEEMKRAGFRVDYHLLEDGHMFPLHRATIARIALEHFGK